MMIGLDRREMGRRLDEWISHTYAHARNARRLPSGRNALKSYIVEVDDTSIAESSNSIVHFLTGDSLPVRVRVERTDDPTLHTVYIGRSQVEFYLDTLDERFWVLHTISPADIADQAVRSLVNRTRRLDSAWIPSDQLETWSGQLGIPRTVTAKFSVPTGLYRDDLPEEEFEDNSFYLRFGSSGDARFRLEDYRQSEALAPSLALWSVRVARRDSERALEVVDEVTAGGKLTCRGNSFRLHQEMVLGFQSRYAELINNWETKYRLGWESTENGGRPTGEIAEITLPDPLDEESAERFLNIVFSCGEPYRLYGVPIRNGASRYVVRGVDLHSGDKVDFEILPDMIRLYLYPTTCANVLARILTNLQHYHDARVRMI